MNDQTGVALLAQPNLELYIRKYRECKGKIEAIEERQKVEPELVKLKRLKEDLSTVLLAHLTATKASSVNTKAGTAIATTRTSASLADPDAFMNFVIANQMWDLIDRRANVTAVRDYATEHSTLPPGVNISVIEKLSVRAPTDK